MKKMINKYKWELTGLLTGAVVGWGYWFFIGCSSGTCVISSKPLNSMLYFGVMGLLLTGSLKKENKKQGS